MDLVRLRYFLTVAKTRNVTRAAELLNVSPPAISKGIKVLENELGVELLIQNGRALNVSPAGEILLAQGAPLLNSLESLRGKLTEVRPPNFRIGSFCEFTSYFVGHLSAQVPSDFAFDIYDLLLPGQMEPALLDETIDAAISLVPLPNPKIEYLKVCTVHHSVYGLAGKFDHLPFVELPFAVPASVVEGSPRPMPSLDGWPEDKFPRRQMYHVTLMETGLELCRRGKAVGFFADFVIDLHNATVKPEFKLVPIDAANKVYRDTGTDVFLAKRKFAQEDTRFKKLSRAIRSIC
jgi:DNA-binding transcriptional LysR family regulator